MMRSWYYHNWMTPDVGVAAQGSNLDGTRLWCTLRWLLYNIIIDSAQMKTISIQLR